MRSKYGENKIGNKKNINVEFVSANPTGPIHIAHIRGAVYGDVYSNILKKNGYNVIKEYYVNDSGSQINVLGNSLYKRYQQLLGKKIELTEGEYPGDYLIKIAENILGLSIIIGVVIFFVAVVSKNFHCLELIFYKELHNFFYLLMHFLTTLILY